MVQLELDQNDAEALSRILKSYLSDLRMEIADTERMAFREQLKKDEVEIKSILDRLSKQGVS